MSYVTKNQLWFAEITHIPSPDRVIQWMNSPAHRSESQRIWDLVCRMSGSSRALYRYVREGKRPPIADSLKHQQMVRELNQFLSEQRYCPQITPPISPGSWITVSWCPRLLQRTRRHNPQWLKRWNHSMLQIHAVIDLLAYANRGLLSNIQQCAECREWFWKRLKTQRFHERKCQQKNYRSSPEWKAHRRDWMREYRNLKKLGVTK